MTHGIVDSGGAIQPELALLGAPFLFRFDEAHLLEEEALSVLPMRRRDAIGVRVLVCRTSSTESIITSGRPLARLGEVQPTLASIGLTSAWRAPKQ